jgi:hypothetical protein
MIARCCRFGPAPSSTRNYRWSQSQNKLHEVALADY